MRERERKNRERENEQEQFSSEPQLISCSAFYSPASVIQSRLDMRTGALKHSSDNPGHSPSGWMQKNSDYGSQLTALVLYLIRYFILGNIPIIYTEYAELNPTVSKVTRRPNATPSVVTRATHRDFSVTMWRNDH